MDSGASPETTDRIVVDGREFWNLAFKTSVVMSREGFVFIPREEIEKRQVAVVRLTDGDVDQIDGDDTAAERIAHRFGGMLDELIQYGRLDIDDPWLNQLDGWRRVRGRAESTGDGNRQRMIVAVAPWVVVRLRSVGDRIRGVVAFSMRLVSKRELERIRVRQRSR